MAITVSSGLKAAAVNQSGSIPIAKIEVFPISGTISESKGLTRRIYDGYYPLADTGTNILNEGGFDTHANWDTTNDFDDTGGNAEYTWSANQTSIVQQIAGDRASIGQDGTQYTLQYTVAVTTAPDGDFALTLENFSGSSIPLPYTAGTHVVQFTSAANATIRAFTIQAVTSTGTEGQFTIDNLFCQAVELALWEDTSNLLAFNYGQFPPLGINPAMLSDNSTWSIRWDGYFKCTRPGGVTGAISYNFGYVSTGYVVVSTGSSAIDDNPGTIQGEGTSPHSINDVGQVVSYGSADDFWLPVTIWYSRSDTNNRVFADERFVMFWQDDVDSEWMIMGSDRTCPVGGRFINRSGTPVTVVNAPLQSPAINVYTLILHSVGGVFHFHKSTDDATEYGVQAGQMTTYALEGAGTQSGVVTITWADTLTHGDVVEVHMIAGNETPWNIPVTDMTIDTSRDGASTLRFKVPVTEVVFNELAVTRNNFSTYALDTDSFGVIRHNRMIRASVGYMVDGEPEFVTRFTGLIQDIEPDHQVDANGTPSITLDITCIDSRVVGINAPVTKIEDMILGAIPNELSYDIAQRFPETTGRQGGNGLIRPPAFDNWNLATMVRTVSYQTGFNATQLWAKDTNGNFLIDDRGVYLEQSPSYPYSITSELGVDYEVDTEIQDIPRNPSSFWSDAWGAIQALLTLGQTKDPNTREVVHWTENASTKEAPYLYVFQLDTAPWVAVRDLCSTYGLELDVNGDGNVYMRYPNNPILYSAEPNTTIMPFVSYDSGWTTPSTSLAIGNVAGLTSTTGAWFILTFTGVGIKLIFTRQNVESKVAVYINNIMVDGINELDSTTGDQGHLDWTDTIQFPGAYVELNFSSLPEGVSNWYYKEGVHPDLGKNPTVFTVTDNLTYGEHTCRVQLFSGTLSFEGFQVIAVSTEQPQHEFDSNSNLLGVTLNATLAAAANDIIIAGNLRGAIGDYILSRAVDMASIYDEDSPNYIGVRKPWYISDPRIINQERADFLAQHLLLRYRRGERSPIVQSSGLPWMETGDPVTIRDMHETSDGSFIPTIGLYSPADLTKTQRIGASGILPLPFQQYWITEINETFSIDNSVPKYVSTMTTSALPPLPAYEPLPEPVQDELVTTITGINITYDAGGATYNPFTSDGNGEFVNIEFNLNWHARSLNVSIVSAQDDVTLPSGNIMYRGQIVNVLLARTGFVPAGKYTLRWDGWIEDENGGMFAPDDLDDPVLPLPGYYSVRIETERYSTGAAFVCRSESGFPGVISGSEPFIQISQDRDAVYSANPFSVVITPTAAPTSPPKLYDLETNSGQGLQIDVTLAAPAQISIPMTIRYTNKSTVPANDPTVTFFDEKWVVDLTGDDAPIMEPGTYTFYFNPLTDVVKNGRRVLPFGASRAVQAQIDWLLRNRERTGTTEQGLQWHVAWHFELASGVICRDKAGTVNFVQPANPTWTHWNWGGSRSTSHTQAERSDSFVTWLFLDVKGAV